MLKRLIFSGLVLFGTMSFIAQKGKSFPALKGATLNDKTISIPIKNDKYTVLAIAFDRKAEDALKRWLNPLYETFIQEAGKSDNTIDIAEVYDVNFVFVPLISGFKRIADDFKSNTDKSFWPYVMDTEKTDIRAVQKSLGVKDDEIPYFYVIDKAGVILEFQSGSYTQAKMDKLEAAIPD